MRVKQRLLGDGTQTVHEDVLKRWVNIFETFRDVRQRST